MSSGPAIVDPTCSRGSQGRPLGRGWEPRATFTGRVGILRPVGTEETLSRPTLPCEGDGSGPGSGGETASRSVTGTAVAAQGGRSRYGVPGPAVSDAA